MRSAFDLSNQLGMSSGPGTGLMTYLTVKMSRQFRFITFGIKQLLDEAEHDIKNYSDRGQCYLPKRS